MSRTTSKFHNRRCRNPHADVAFGSRPTKLMVSKTSPLSTPIADIGADMDSRRFGPYPGNYAQTLLEIQPRTIPSIRLYLSTPRRDTLSARFSQGLEPKLSKNGVSPKSPLSPISSILAIGRRLTPKSAFRRDISHRERACEHDIIIRKK